MRDEQSDAKRPYHRTNVLDAGVDRVKRSPERPQENPVPTLQVDGITIAVIDHPTAYGLLEAGKRKIGKVRPPDTSPASAGTGTRPTIVPAQTFTLTVDFP